MRKRPLIMLLIIFPFIFFSVLSCEKSKDKDFAAVELPSSVNEENAVLVIEGKIVPEKVFLNNETLFRFPKTTFISYDPWDEKEQTFTGVSISGLLKFLNAESSVELIEVEAENGYKVPIRIEDLERFEYILAYEQNGVLLSSGDSPASKGNLIVAINFKKHPDIDIEIYKNQLVWQVIRISVE